MARAKASRGEARRKLELLSALRPILCADGEVYTILKVTADEIARSAADFCVVDALLRSGKLGRLAIAHADASRLEDLRGACARFVAPAGGPAAKGLGGGAAKLVNVAGRRRGARDDVDFDFLGGEPATSYMQVPVCASGAPFALLTLVNTKSKPFDEDALAFFEEVAAWCGLSVEKALLKEAQPRVSYGPPQLSRGIRSSALRRP